MGLRSPSQPKRSLRVDDHGDLAVRCVVKKIVDRLENMLTFCLDEVKALGRKLAVGIGEVVGLGCGHLCGDLELLALVLRAQQLVVPLVEGRGQA